MTLGGARFEPYVERDAQGCVHFANRLIPVRLALLRPGPVRRRRRSDWPARSLHARQVKAAVLRASRLADARGWLPCNPMLAHQMRVEDARMRT